MRIVVGWFIGGSGLGWGNVCDRGGRMMGGRRMIVFLLLINGFFVWVGDWMMGGGG